MSVVTSPKIRIIEMEAETKQQQQALLQDPKLLTKEERNDFNSTFNMIVQALTENSEMRDMAETNRWLAKVLQHNVPHGKKNRGLATVLAYKFMTPELTEENMQLSYILGWCVEMLQAFFLVADDIMDHSETRRGRPCWYKVDNLGPAAFNDAILLETSIYVLLSKYFRNKDYYVDLLEIFHDATNKTTFGQSIDTRTGLQRRMEGYTMELYSAIVKYKTSFYSFVLPVHLAMAMAGISSAELRRQAQTVTLEMGHFFQIQDDYLDCFGDEQVTGKIGTDIQDCKCSWLFVQAMQRASEEQRETLLANYGQTDPTKVEVIKNLYIELQLPQVYKDFEESSYNTISSHILQMSHELPKSLFMDMLQKIYKRSS